VLGIGKNREGRIRVNVDPHAEVSRTIVEDPSSFSPRKLFKIGEVMRFSGLSRQTVHNYTHQGLITEVERTPSGHRLYGEDVFVRLQMIFELKNQHTLRQIKAMLEDRLGDTHV